MARARPHGSRVKPYFAPPRPRVLAHRGLAIDTPENTMLAFAKAVAAGANYIETDVRASLDGVAMVCHDEDLARVAGRDIRVSQLTFAELRRVDLGYGQGFCSLAEAVDAFPETRFNIDLKSADVVDPAVAAVQKLGAVDRVLMTSFGEERRRAAVAALPGVATSASARLFVGSLFAAKLTAGLAAAWILRGVDAVQVPQRALGLQVTTRRMIEQFHAAGVEVHVWTINDPATMTMLLDLGVDGLVTDRADLALEVAKAHREFE